MECQIRILVMVEEKRQYGYYSCNMKFETFFFFVYCTQVFFIDDWRQPAWKIVVQKEPWSRWVVDTEDEQMLGISGNYEGLNLPVDLNAAEFRPRIRYDGDVVPEAEVARLNALVTGERPHEVGARGRGRRGHRRYGSCQVRQGRL
jgi:hypothetical protein